MRSVKFRVYVESVITEESGVYYPDYISLLSNSDNSIDKVYAERNGIRYKFKDDTCKFTLMQYTGVNDNNGREVYEGDIVRIGGYRARVYWDDRSARFLLEPIGAGVMNTRALSAVRLRGSVTGNIYEHPHLLDSAG